MLIVDTAGLDPDAEDPLGAAVQAQARSAVREADAVLFVVDGKVVAGAGAQADRESVPWKRLLAVVALRGGVRSAWCDTGLSKVKTLMELSMCSCAGAVVWPWHGRGWSSEAHRI